MSVTAPRCHLCLQVKRLTPSGLLLCDHCDKGCPVDKKKHTCDHCEQGEKSQGRGPSS